jgi:hypothetical protein
VALALASASPARSSSRSIVPALSTFTCLHRVDLDVEQDSWDTDQAGGTKPIAEFADHLVATLTVSVEGREVATATSPVATGSWGALGAD